MTPQEITARRAELQSMVARGFNDYETALEFLDVIERQAARIAELEKQVTAMREELGRPADRSRMYPS